MTTGALVIGLVVGLFAGARWARARRALLDLRGIKSGVGKARSAFWATVWAAAFGIVLIGLFLLASAAGMFATAGR